MLAPQHRCCSVPIHRKVGPASRKVHVVVETPLLLALRCVFRVREDMDLPSATLIGAHGYCTQVWHGRSAGGEHVFQTGTFLIRFPPYLQELVNLLVWGRAVPNVFDNDVELDSGHGNVTLLKGIKSHCDVGLLSLFEHYNICKVRGGSWEGTVLRGGWANRPVLHVWWLFMCFYLI